MTGIGIGIGTPFGAGPAAPASAVLLSGETTGFAADFTQATDNQRVSFISAGVINTQSPDTTMVVANTIVPKMVFTKAGQRVFVPHNFYFNSSAPATQTRTVIVGATYTVSITGSGSLALTGAATGTVTAASPVTFVASTTSLVSTKTATLATMQLNRGATATAYLATAGIARFGVPISWDAGLGSFVLLCEPTRTNSLLNSTAPVTQTVSLVAGSYILWIEGAGSCVLSGGPTGTATAGSPVTFTLGSTTSVTFTISGSVTAFQVEVGAVATSLIETFGAALTRAIDNPNLLLSAIGPTWTEASFYIDFVYTGPTGNQVPIQLVDTIGAAENIAVVVASSVLSSVVSHTNVLQANYSNGSVGANTRIEATLRAKVNLIASSMNGAPIGVGCQDVVATMPVPLLIYFGSAISGPMKIRRAVIIPRALPSSKVATWRNTITTDPTPYDVFLVAGQSNTNNGFQIDVSIDVSDPKVDAIDQTGAVANASEPLPHFVPPAGRNGFALAFARDYYVPNALASGRKVLIVPCGLINTGFSDSRWGVGNDLNTATLSLAGLALAKYPNAVLKGIFFMQGERDAQAGWSQATYEAAQGPGLQIFRDELGSNVPIVVGGMVPQWVASDPTFAPVAAGVLSTTTRFTRAAFADPSTPTVIPGRSTDIIHYDAFGQRGPFTGGPFSSRWWTAYQTVA